MSFIDKSIKNVKKSVLKEITGGEATSGFTGKAGMDIDALFAGPFKSNDGNKLSDLLAQQLEDRKKKIKDTDSFEPHPVGGYYNTDTVVSRLAYDELISKIISDVEYNNENTPEHDVEWKSTGVNIDFDDIYTHIEDEENFINKSETNMELVGVDIKYDDKPEYAGENFINKSKTNWKLVGDNG